MKRPFIQKKAFAIRRPFIIIGGLFVIVAIIGAGAFLMPLDAKIRDYYMARTAKEVVADYTDKALLKTLSLFTDSVEAFNLAVNRLQAEKTDQALNAAANAWRATHRQWQKAAAFLYGPAAQYDYHKRIATWPFDKVLVEYDLGEIEKGKLKVDSRLLREKKTSSMRGLYTLEYLLFRDRTPRRAADVSPAELSWLAAASKALLEESIDFEAAWLGTENLPSRKAAVLDQAGIRPKPAYAGEFKNPGEPGSRYVSISVPLQEIFQEMTGVVEDMMPLVAELPETLAPADNGYWHGQDPCGDLLNRLKSVENAYLGGVEGARGRSVSDLVAEMDKVLDRRIKIALAHAAHRIAAVRDLQGAPEEEMELAVRIAGAECNKLMTRITAAIPAVVLDHAVRPWVAYGK